MSFIQVLHVSAKKYWKLLLFAFICLGGGATLTWSILSSEALSVSPTVINALTIASLFFVGLGGVIIYGFIFNLVLQTKQLLNCGVKASGKIISFDNNPVYPEIKAIVYEYTDKTGKKHSSTTSFLEQTVYEKWKVGDSGVISFAPNKPENSIWIGENWKIYLS